ncbi:glycosyltransferase [Bradyrhizobium sp. B117]|uniref:glycosyltransferase n=1 Tax=Bradyrhizobium sp. B117 TaxID=3140246 RepID=UPI003183E91B
MTTAADRRPVVVSLTPLPLSADSRTLKQVVSVHRLGFRSIVLEGQKSQLARADVPIELISSLETPKASPVEVRQIEVRQSAHETASSAPCPDCAPNPHRGAALLKLRDSRLGSFLRPLPGMRAIARVLVPGLDRLNSAIVSARKSGAIVAFTKIAFRGVIDAIIGTLKRVAGLAANQLPAWAFYHPTLFVRHLGTYLNRYVFSVLAVTPRADIYYLHAFYQFPAVWILCLRYRAKMIYDAHDFYSQLEDDGSLSSFWKNWVLPFERFVERLCVRFADDVVTVNDGIADLMRKRFGRDPIILRNAHDPRLDRAPAGTIREAIGLPADAFLVVSIGNWKPGMAMAQMFDALSKLPRKVHLAFLGAGYPPLDEAINSRGIDGRVHVVPPVLPQEVVPFIKSADASVVLYYGKSINYQNALPNRFFQSIAAKLPLVYPDLTEMRRLADRYQVGLLADPQHPDQIEAALRVLIDNPEQRIALRKNLDLASGELCWEREERVLRALLHQHLGIADESCSETTKAAVH